MRVCPRATEDGTAIDAFKLVAPGGAPPAADTVLGAGASTTSTCSGGPRFAEPIKAGADLMHQDGDARGWGHHMVDGATPKVGLECGLCLVPLDDPKNWCPPPEALQTMPTCDNVTIGEMCEADGECGTDVRLNNCPNSLPDPDANGGDGDGGKGKGGGGRGGPTRRNRNNDVYKRVPCSQFDHGGGGGDGGTAAAVVVAVVLVLAGVAGLAYAYVRLSRKHHGGITVLPWKWTGGLLGGAGTSTAPAVGGGGATGPLPSHPASVGSPEVGAATEYGRAV